jgi:hypothetical protein
MKNNAYLRLALDAIHALQLVLPRKLLWFGVPALVEEDASRSLLIDALSGLLYRQFYCMGRAVGLPAEAGPAADPGRVTAFVATLAAANHASGLEECDWLMQSSDRDSLLVRRDGIAMRVAAGEWKLGAAPRYVCVEFPSGSSTLSPGFYFVKGGKPSNGQKTVRVYWNVGPTQAAEWLEEITSEMRDRSISYSCKVLADPAAYNRCDSAVLYLGREDYLLAVPVLQKLHQKVREGLRPETPVFTCPIAPGLAVAEQPDTNLSFGQHRCQLLAEGLVSAEAAGRRSSAQRLAHIAEHFRAQGIALEKPYLGAGSSQEYAFPLGNGSVPASSLPERRHSAPRADQLGIAARIGEQLVRTALWDGKACIWLGNVDGRQDAFGALGADLYSGTSGIAWFLAELYRVTGEDSFREAALGAIHQSLEAADNIEPTNRSGLYVGWTGIAFSAIHCSRIFEAPSLRLRARNLLRTFCKQELNGRLVVDVISGEAGTILGLASFEEEAPPGLLSRLGQELVRTATRMDDGWSWRTINRGRELNLTGFSHGASGIAAALVVLYGKTHDPGFREAALGALRWEHARFDCQAQNWPDFRGRTNRRQARQFARAWCHGAPGTALALAAASNVLDRVEFLQEDLAAALDTTGASISPAALEDANFCLCHGVAGNADVLALTGACSAPLVLEAAAFGAQQYGNGTWPCGAGVETMPGLMVGLAGIGHFYLRLHNPQIQSPLAIGLQSLTKLERISAEGRSNGHRLNPGNGRAAWNDPER